MSPAKPSLDLLRSLTDENVLRAFMTERRLTRAELAVRTGISKPTMSDSVARLTQAGLLRDTGERTRGPGRIGTYYALADDAGVALVVSVAPDGLVAELVNPFGDVVAHEVRAVSRPARAPAVRRAVSLIGAAAARQHPGPVRLAVVSAADPVDRASGRLLHMPDAPFLIGDLSPVDALGPLVEGPVIVDNDVNWAARAERSLPGPALDDFAYLYLGEGLGCAIVSDSEVRRGHQGLIGEVAHVITAGRRQRAVLFTDVFAELGLRRAGSAAVDTERLLARVAAPGKGSGELRTALAAAVGGVLLAIVTLADPSVIVIGGTWGPHPQIFAALAAHAQTLPRPALLRPAAFTQEPSLAGARLHAIDALRSAVVALA